MIADSALLLVVVKQRNLNLERADLQLHLSASLRAFLDVSRTTAKAVFHGALGFRGLAAEALPLATDHCSIQRPRLPIQRSLPLSQADLYSYFVEL